MSSISSLTKSISGLQAAQKGLQVTGHNISNANTKGYTRQQLLQADSPYITIGDNGGNSMKVGLGVTCTEIRQIRDDLADKRFRNENSVLSYYQKLNNTTSEIESVFDEPYGNTISDLINQFWAQTQKLATDPSGVETRMSFISTAKVLASKLNTVSDSLTTYQGKLNMDLGTSVKRVNEIVDEIAKYNDKISLEESAGANANDYRDERNVLLDELSGYGEISYYEQPDHRVYVQFERHVVVDKSHVNKLELKQAEAGSPFKVPIWSDTKSEAYDLTDRVTSVESNDTGSIKAILVARGNNIVDTNTTWDDVALNDNFSCDVEGNAFIIPKLQMMLNDFTNKLTESVNDSFNGTGIGNHLGKDGIPVFVATNVPDTDNLKTIKAQIIKDGYTSISASDLEKYNKYLVAGNVEVNPALLEDGGYNKLGTVSKPSSPTPDSASKVGDNSIVNKFLAACGVTDTWYNRSSVGGSTPAPETAPYQKTSTIKDYFSELVTDIGNQGSLYTNKATQKSMSVTNIENERKSMGGVSTDEEFTYMLKYQYAYNSSARVITLLDSMLDTIINKM